MKNRRWRDLLLIVGGMVFFSCSPRVLDDFFGIEMNPAEMNDFKIVSYSPQEGARYQSNIHMNPRVYAYAEVYMDFLQLKVVNTSDKPIIYDYATDEFFLFTRQENQKFVLAKGEREKYPSGGEIAPGESQEFTLLLPLNYGETLGVNAPPFQKSSYSEKFWKGQNTGKWDKKEIDHILVILNGQTSIVLKPISHPSEK